MVNSSYNAMLTASVSTVFFNAGSGRSFTPVDFGDGKGTAYGFDVADLDGDGRLDIVALPSASELVVLRGDGHGSFTPRPGVPRG